MKLNKNFLVHKNGKETIVVPTGSAEFSGIIRGNQTLGMILDLLRKDTTEQQIIAAIVKKYDVSREIVEKDVQTTVSRLKTIGAIEE